MINHNSADLRLAAFTLVIKALLTCDLGKSPAFSADCSLNFYKTFALLFPTKAVFASFVKLEDVFCLKFERIV